MTVGCTYLVAYRRGLLRRLVEAVRAGRHYLEHPGSELSVERKSARFQDELPDEASSGDDDPAAAARPPRLHLAIRDRNDWCRGRYPCSRVTLWPTLGVLEVLDGRRYHLASDDEHVHTRQFFAGLMDGRGGRFSVGADWMCPWEFPDLPGDADCDRLTEEEALLELPQDLLSDLDCALLLAGAAAAGGSPPGAGPDLDAARARLERARGLAGAIYRGDAAAVEALGGEAALRPDARRLLRLCALVGGAECTRALTALLGAAARDGAP